MEKLNTKKKLQLHEEKHDQNSCEESDEVRHRAPILVAPHFSNLLAKDISQRRDPRAQDGQGNLGQPDFIPAHDGLPVEIQFTSATMKTMGKTAMKTRILIQSAATRTGAASR